VLADLKDYNLARAIILVALLGSLVLGWLCWQRSTALEKDREDLQLRMNSTITSLRQAAQRHTMLSQSLKGEGLKGQEDLVSYIRRVGA
jgi:hypothetical protein